MAQSFAPIVQMMRKNGPFTKALNEQLRKQIQLTVFSLYFIHQMADHIGCISEFKIY